MVYGYFTQDKATTHTEKLSLTALGVVSGWNVDNLQVVAF
jgi:hypothetical protein